MTNSSMLARVAAIGTTLAIALASIAFDIAETRHHRARYRESVLNDLGLMRTALSDILERQRAVVTAIALGVSAQQELTESEFLQLVDGFAQSRSSCVRIDVILDPQTRYNYLQEPSASRPEIPPELTNASTSDVRAIPKTDGRGYWLGIAVPIDRANASADDTSLVVGMFDLDAAIDEGDLDEQFAEFDYLLLDPDDRTSIERPFAGESDVFLRQPVSGDVRFENVAWQLAVTPEDGWDVVPAARFWTRLSSLLLTVGTGGVVLFVLETPRWRRQAVRRAISDLERREQRYRSLVENANSIVIQLSETGEVELFNQFASNVFGLSAEESLGRDLGTLVARPQQAYPIHECLRTCLRNGHDDREIECVRSSGSPVWIAWSFKAIYDANGRAAGAIVTGNDVTVHRQLERELQSSEAELSGLLEAMTDAIFTLDRAGNYVRVFSTRATQRLDRDRIIGRSVTDVLGEAIGNEVRRQIQTCLDRRQPVEFEYSIGVGDRQQWLDAMVSPFGDDLALLVARDVSARHAAEEELRQAKAELEARVAARAGEINDANKSLQREIVERMQIEDALRQSEEREREKASQLQTTLQDLKRAQTQLVQTEKMSSLGQLAAGMAHEINNPVNFIHGNIRPLRDYTGDLLSLIDLFQREYPQDNAAIDDFIDDIDFDFLCEDLDKALDSMQVGTERIRNIIHSLQNFSRLDETGMKRVDLLEGIHSALNVLKSRLRAKDGRPEIEVRCDLAPLPKVMCYPSQINQVAIDILGNAIDALTEKYQDPQADGDEPPQIAIRAEVIDDDRVRISIADNANGMTPETVEQIFTPFFTTKPVGKGTGLGLSVAYQTVHDSHDGQLSCHSVVGKGSTFEIVLPIANREKAQIQQAIESATPDLEPQDAP